MKLKLGKMTGREIAKWLGISYDGTYRKSPSKYIVKLQDYCKYKTMRGGVTIEEIYIEEYNPNLRIERDKQYLIELKAQRELMSMSGAAENIPDTSRYILTQSRDYLFGKDSINKTSESRGLLGNREMIWAIKLYDRPNHYRYLTPEEEEIFDELIIQTYTNIDPQKVKDREILLQECADKDLTVGEFQSIAKSKNINFFDEVVNKFYVKTRMRLAVATKHEIIYEEIQDFENPEKYDPVYRKFLLDFYKTLPDPVDDEIDAVSSSPARHI